LEDATGLRACECAAFADVSVRHQAGLRTRACLFSLGSGSVVTRAAGEGTR
jgi:hypothetical protein